MKVESAIIHGFGSKCPFRTVTMSAKDWSFRLEGANRLQKVPYVSHPTEVCKEYGTFLLSSISFAENNSMRST